MHLYTAGMLPNEVISLKETEGSHASTYAQCDGGAFSSRKCAYENENI